MPITKQDYIQTQPITKAALLTLYNRGVEEAQNQFEIEYEEAASEYFAANNYNGSTWHKLTVLCKIPNPWKGLCHRFGQDTCFFKFRNKYNYCIYIQGQFFFRFLIVVQLNQSINIIPNLNN